MQRAAAGAPPSYSTLGLLNSSKIVANASGEDKELDRFQGGVHPIRSTSRTIGRVVKREVDTNDFLRRGTGQPACDSTARLGQAVGRASSLGRARYGGDYEVEYDEDGNECPGGGYDATGARLPASFRGGAAGRSASESRGRVAFVRTRVADPKPGVPAVGDVPLCGLKSDKNYVVANAVEAAQAPTRHKQVVVPRAVDRPTYGQVPPYLERMKEEVSRERSAAVAVAHTRGGAGSASPRGGDGMGVTAAGFELMDDAEKEQVLAGLKAKWTDRNKQYQQLSFRLDTRSKVLRKEFLERELERIEAFISKLSKPKVVVKP